MTVLAQVPGPISPLTGQAYPTHYSTLGFGGWREAIDSTARDNIPVWLRAAGMACMVLTSAGADPAGPYTLDQNLTTWSPLTSRKDFTTVANAAALPSVAAEGNAAITADNFKFQTYAGGSWGAQLFTDAIYASSVTFDGAGNQSIANSGADLLVGVIGGTAQIFSTARVDLRAPTVQLSNAAYQHFGGLGVDASGNLVSVDYSFSAILGDDVKVMLSDGSSFSWKDFYGLPQPSAGDIPLGVSAFGNPSWGTLAKPSAAGSLIVSGSGGTPAWSSSPTIAGTLTVQGDLVVQGTHTTVDSTSVQVKDRVVQVNRTAGTAPVPTNICGLSVLRGNTGSADRDPYGVFWDEANSTWVFAKNTGGDDATLGADLALRVLSLRVSGLSTGVGHYDSSGNLTSSLIVDADVSGVSTSKLSVPSGATGDLLVGSSTSLVRLAIVAAGSVLISGTSPAWSASPSLTGITLTGLTASKYVVTDSGKALASQTGVPWTDLTGVSSAAPTFADITDSGLTASQYVKTDGSKKLVSAASIPVADISNTSGATGDLLVGTGATSLGRLAVGATGTYLKGGSTPAWAAPTFNELTGTLSNDLAYTGAILGGDQTHGGTEGKLVQVASNSNGTALVALSYAMQTSAAVDFRARVVLRRTSGTPATTDLYSVDVTGFYYTDSSGASTASVALALSNASPTVSGVTVSAAINSGSTPHKIEISVTVPNTQTWQITIDYGRTSAK